MLAIILSFFISMAFAQNQNFCVKNKDNLETFQNKMTNWQAAIKEDSAGLYPQIEVRKNIIFPLVENSKGEIVKNNKIVKIKDKCGTEVIFTSLLKNADTSHAIKKGTEIFLTEANSSIEYFPLFKTIYFTFPKKKFSVSIKLKNNKCNIYDLHDTLYKAGLGLRVIYPKEVTDCSEYKRKEEKAFDINSLSSPEGVNVDQNIETENLKSDDVEKAQSNSK